MARRGPDTGLVPADTRFSPSQAESYLSCPRLYAFRRWLRMDADGSAHLLSGSLIHLVLEQVEGAAIERGDAHATLDEALAALDENFDPAEFGGGHWAAAWHARAVRKARYRRRYPPLSNIPVNCRKNLKPSGVAINMRKLFKPRSKQCKWE